jgi:hypothetical protein
MLMRRPSRGAGLIGSPASSVTINFRITEAGDDRITMAGDLRQITP